MLYVYSTLFDDIRQCSYVGFNHRLTLIFSSNLRHSTPWNDIMWQVVAFVSKKRIKICRVPLKETNLSLISPPLLQLQENIFYKKIIYTA